MRCPRILTWLPIMYATQLSLFTHHMWIGGFLAVGAAAHAAIFMVRDYDPTTQYNNLLDRVIRHRDAIISHLNWHFPSLGFHNHAVRKTFVKKTDDRPIRRYRYQG